MIGGIRAKKTQGARRLCGTGSASCKGEVIGRVGTAEVTAQIDGILRGLIRSGSVVKAGLKIGDVDPRGEAELCRTISEKARALGGAVLEAILAVYNV